MQCTETLQKLQHDGGKKFSTVIEVKVFEEENKTVLKKKKNNFTLSVKSF